jgi:hypothetical protein
MPAREAVGPAGAFVGLRVYADVVMPARPARGLPWPNRLSASHSSESGRRVGTEPSGADSSTSSNAVDAGALASPHSPSPIADWLDFLADLIAAEILREWEDGGSTQ